ncbi:hypothetical protein SAMN05421538_104195 [Paracoccus isoporae]|uniref:Uncharacterized protein n=1 Tax=Paracoccus isoporae TaxID=591205 RepID=A0A1G7AMY3_9RHOB|nr:hypothetical protein [Paracoccus isoporae]SDE16123.1 hypothetical protein SAMN05421538_104195 [Paracoccus isoporae]
MTADLSTNEFMTFSDPSRAPGAAAPRNEPVFHQYGRVAIADAPGVTDPAPPSPYNAAEMSATELMGAHAFRRRSANNSRAAGKKRNFEGLSWQGAADGGPAPIHPPGEALTRFDTPAPPQWAAPEELPPLSARMTGRIAVGLVIVSGTAAHLRFTTDEQLLVVSEVQNGLSFLANEAPQKDVTFVHDISVLSVSAAEAPPDARDFDAFEAPWRDGALAQLGHRPGLAGADAYARALRDRHGTDWAYIAFFTKYRLWHFAYASLGGPRLVMHFDNDGWGPEQIDRVFAHETGHIFHAPDEYAQSGCDCGGAWGHFGEPNRNCANCAPGGSQKCIMQSNDWAMCDATRRHLGYSGLSEI